MLLYGFRSLQHQHTALLDGGLYHSHLGEVHQVVLGVVGCALLYEGQVGQVHTQVRHTGRVTAKGCQAGQRASATSQTHTLTHKPYVYTSIVK